MNPLYHQLFGVIVVILMLGLLGMLFAWLERLDRGTPSFEGPMGTLGLTNEEALRRAEEILRRRPAAEAEDAPQHDLEHK